MSRKGNGGSGRSSGRSSNRGRKKGVNWSFVIAGAILLSTYLIVVLFNGTDWQGWNESLDDLRETFAGAADTVKETLKKADSEFGSSSSPDDLTLDLPGSGTVSVHFIDVGQGDSILVSGSGQNVLIDAGENDQGETVLSYLAEQEVGSIDLAVGTHPHSDHIGGMDTVIEGITVKELLMPDVPDSIVPTTRTYLSLLSAAEKEGTEMLYGYLGDSFSLCGGTFTVLGPTADYKDLNNDSDAKLSADVLKVGHHGSRTSTSKAFLSAVDPQIAVIECGTGNDYGHPHTEVMDRLEQADITVYRTDLDGNIVITTGGKHGDLKVKTDQAA